MKNGRTTQEQPTLLNVHARCITLYPIRICTGCVARSSKRERESKSLPSCAAVSAELSSPVVRSDGRMVLLLQGHEPFHLLCSATSTHFNGYEGHKDSADILCMHAKYFFKLCEHCHEYVFYQRIWSVSIMVGIHLILVPHHRCSPYHFDLQSFIFSGNVQLEYRESLKGGLQVV